MTDDNYKNSAASSLELKSMDELLSPSVVQLTTHGTCKIVRQAQENKEEVR